MEKRETKDSKSLTIKTKFISKSAINGDKKLRVKKGGDFMLKVFCFLIYFLLMILLETNSIAIAQGIYKITFSDIERAKAIYDDPKPLYEVLSHKNVLPTDIYSKVAFDPEAMKKLWAEIVGFKAPDQVGKIAPEIKPGTYNYMDKDKYPFKELMIPYFYNQFRAPGPPLMGTFSNIKVIPTRQYYWALPISEATKKNMGKTRLNDKGYLIYETYESGIPFPRPEGSFKAQQLVYNWEKRYVNGESFFYFGRAIGYDKRLREDFDSQMLAKGMKFEGRVIFDPKGWFDDRARKNQEGRAYLNEALSPRDIFGNVVFWISYNDPDKYDLFLLYINAMRRIRKLSATDTQDPMAGQDLIYDDGDAFIQKLTPKRYPYKFEIIGEREYLLPAYTLNYNEYTSSKTKEFVDWEFERRPMYVVKLTQLDKNYVYGQRILYFDKETLILVFIENYDQKGRLYRTGLFRNVFHPDQGMFYFSDLLAQDHIDLHSTWQRVYIVPAPNLTRDDFVMGAMGKIK